MNKRLQIYLGLFFLIVILIVYADAIKPKPINWFPSYVSKHKIPYGTYVLKNQLPKLFPKTTIKEIHQPPYLHLQDTTLQGTYIFIDDAVNFGVAEFNAILKFVKRGNDVFLATNGAIIDTLGLKTTTLITTIFNEKEYNTLLNPQFSNKNYYFNRKQEHFYFEEIDTLQTIALGTITKTSQDSTIITTGVNFIKHPYGKGNFYINTFPQAYTNYGILNQNYATYIAQSFSYLNNHKPIFLDAYYKTGKSKITNPLNYIISSKHLKWAYYVALIGIVFFVIFKGKREQKNIPIRVPLKNQTVAFTRTISNMYYEKMQHKEIANHKINYFLDWIRTKVYLPTHTLNQLFLEQLASRTQNTLEDTKKLFNQIAQIKKQQTISKTQLITLNTLIEAYKNK